MACQDALLEQREAVRDPDRTPSACMLAAMRAHGEGYFHFAKRMSELHHAYFMGLPQDRERFAAIEAAVTRSVADQQAIEAADKLSFDEFLHDYFAQSL
jgi:glutamate--cysteine ligase